MGGPAMQSNTYRDDYKPGRPANRLYRMFNMTYENNGTTYAVKRKKPI